MEESSLATTFATPDRSHFDTIDTITDIWTSLDLPSSALSSLSLGAEQDQPVLPSSFKISHLAHATVALSCLAASLVDSTRNAVKVMPKVTVPLRHAAAEFASEQVYTLNGNPPPSSWGTIGGMHKTADGHVRIHDSFPHHRAAALRLLGLPSGASREDVAEKLRQWKSLVVESAARQQKAVIYALRPYSTWSSMPQCQSLPSYPIAIRRLSSASSSARCLPSGSFLQLLSGLRVLELSRVIAAPVAGRTLAAHGADVLWVTSPNLPSLPDIDIDVSRGKRTIHLDLDSDEDRNTIRRLLRDADVLIQSYRPGALAAKGFSTTEVVEMCPEGIVVANLSAWGDDGPWSEQRGFDSMVQTVSGLNIDESEAFEKTGGEPSAAKVLPVQALDHASGYLLATGVLAALYHRAREGGSWEVAVSLAGTGKFLRSLGRDEHGFAGDVNVKHQTKDFMEVRETGFGVLEAVRHAATVDGKEVEWKWMPKKLGSDAAEWL